MLAFLYGHTANNVLGSTTIFRFSHDFIAIPLKHLVEWLNGEKYLEFKLRKVMVEESIYQHVQYTFMNNMIYRHVELEHLGCYELIARCMIV